MINDKKCPCNEYMPQCDQFYLCPWCPRSVAMFTYAALTFSSVAILVQYYAREWAAQDARVWFNHLESNPVPHVETFDFIVVGGGTTGCVVASRLSESGRFNVLLLEAGGNPPPQLLVPAYRTHFDSVPEVAYQYRAKQNDQDGVGVVLLAGKVLGGTSSINAGFFNRGHPLDYDSWADATGDKSWRYDNLLKYFKRLEDYQGAFPNGEQHATDGYVTISQQVYAPGLKTLIEAGHELGYENRDPNGPQQEHVGSLEWTRTKEGRVDSFTSYLKGVEGKRKNLKIYRYSTATEIVLNDNKRAIGVAYERHGILQFAKASKEIILSAGALGSPMLLLRSGIGPKEELKKIPDITQKHDLPVGQNLRDHPLIPFRIFVNDSSLHFDPIVNITEDTLREWHENGHGPLSLDKPQAGQAFFVTNSAKAKAKGGGQGGGWPNIQVAVYAQDPPWNRLPMSPSKRPGEVPIYMHPYLGRGKSAGTVKLNPNDLKGPPLIDLNYFSHPADMVTYIEGIKAALRIFEETKAYGRVGARYPTEPVSGCETLEFRSDAYWECFVRQMSFSGCHAVGTCRMGKKDDPRAVVDSKLKVRGIVGLRVADASIMPTIVNSNTQAACYMIGEKVSDEIVKQWSMETDHCDERGHCEL